MANYPKRKVPRRRKKRGNKAAVYIIAVLAVAAIGAATLHGCGVNDGRSVLGSSQSGSSSVLSKTQSSLKHSSTPLPAPSRLSSISVNPSVEPTYSVSDFVGQSDDWRLALANRNNIIKPDEGQLALTAIPRKYCQDSQNYRIDSRAYDDLITMIEAAEDEGVKLVVLSSYRPVSSQQRLYNNKVNYYLNKGYSSLDAQEAAATVVAPPGTSDHGLALGVDFNYLEQSDENTAELTWLRENAEQYGFVMRYRKDKQNVTGVSYEPWHFRYVGIEHAAAMNDAGLCLEEYVENLVN